MIEATRYDVAIVGGGMVGATLAVALADTTLNVALIEAVPFRSDSQPSYNARCIALAEGSQRIYSTLGLWPQLRAYTTPMAQIHISEKGNFGVTRLDAKAEGVAALGYVIESRVLGNVLLEHLRAAPNIDILCPAKLENIVIANGHAELSLGTVAGSRDIQADLVVAADGDHSFVRQQLGIEELRSDYDQTSIITTVTPSRCHNNVAYERFTPQGPIALLPLSENRCSLVFTVKNAEAGSILQLSDKDFIDRLTERFGHRLGDFVRIGPRKAYPLTFSRAKEHVRQRLALIGNAAHTLHPIAGQGFNLGLRDVALLAQTVLDAKRANQDIGALCTLDAYKRWRDHDHARVIAFTDGLARVFSNTIGLFSLARGAGLVLSDICPPIKSQLVRQSMGLSGPQPRLASGLPL